MIARRELFLNSLNLRKQLPISNRKKKETKEYKRTLGEKTHIGELHKHFDCQKETNKQIGLIRVTGASSQISI